ncbi:MAG: hypothetical protein K2G30_01765 [Muribaculaceae bacterium]|nr:hypothetical protein [Muribaculaceae bacterium]
MDKSRVCFFAAALTAMFAAEAQSSYLIEGEAFQFKGKWVVEKSSECLGTAMLRVFQDNDSSPEADALTVVDIAEAGTYQVWTRSQDFLGSVRPRTYTLTVGDAKMAPSGAHGYAGFRWERVGEAVLPKKQTLLRISDTGLYYGRCDAILLTKDATIDPNTLTNTEVARWRRKPVAMDYTTSDSPSLEAPRDITAGYTVLATASNSEIRVSFVKLADGSICCKTDYYAAGSWRRFVSTEEDNRVALLSNQAVPTVNHNQYYPAWDYCAARRGFSFDGTTYPVTIDGDNSNPYFAGTLSEPHPAEVTKTAANTIKVTYDCGGAGELTGYWTVPEHGSHAAVRMVFRPVAGGAYSIALHALKGVGDDAAGGVAMPPLFAGNRLPETPLMMFSSMMPQCVSAVETMTPSGNATAFVCADLDSFSQDWGGYDYSPVGFTLRNSRGEVEPVAFSPLPGMKDSAVSAGRAVEARFVVGVVTGGWGDAVGYASENIFGVGDYRRQTSASLTSTIGNVVELLKDTSACGWNRAMKGFWDIEANGNTSPTVVQSAPLALLGASAVAYDEELYETRALPSVEYALSRNGYRTVGNASQALRPMDSQFPTSLYEGINTLTGGLNPWLAAHGIPGGEVRSANGYFSTLQPFRQALSAYRLTGEESWLDKAVALADGYIGEIYAGSTQVPAAGTFYNSQIAPDWTPLLDIYRTTGEQRYAEAASYAAAHTIAGIKTWPKVAGGTQTVHPGGKYDGVTTVWWRGTEQYRLGFPRVEGDAPEREADAWRVSGVGLGMEQPATYFVRTSGKAVRPVYMSSWAPRLQELSWITGKTLYETFARNAVIGRADNYPGYYATGYTDINLSPAFPYTGPDISSIYYHHIPAYLAMLQDFLVGEFEARSRGEVCFPAARQEGFVWFANNIYGAARGSVYGNEAVLWMPSGAVSVDDQSVNVLTARDSDRFYILLTGEGEEPVNVRVTLGEEVARQLAGSQRVYSVEVPPREVRLLALDACWESFAEAPALEDGMSVVETNTAAGKLYLYRIRSPFGWDSLYGFADCGAVSGLSVTVDCAGTTKTAASWPYEWSFGRFGYDEAATMKITITLNGLELKSVEHTFDPGLSGVETVRADGPEAGRQGVYRIDGARIESPDSPGFYIVDGRKMFKK